MCYKVKWFNQGKCKSDGKIKIIMKILNDTSLMILNSFVTIFHTSFIKVFYNCKVQITKKLISLRKIQQNHVGYM